MMKHFHIYLILSCAILLLNSCGAEDRYGLSEDTGTYKLSVSVSGSEVVTRAGDTGPDDSVNSLDLLVFNKNKQMILNKSARSRYLEDVELPGKQELTIYAVVNSQTDFSKIKRLDEFLAMRSVAKDSEKDNLVMVGHVTATLTRNTVIDIPVKRLAAKIVIERLEYRVPECDNADVHYPMNIYLDNIAYDCPYSMELVAPTKCIDTSANCPIGCVSPTRADYHHKDIDGEEYYYLKYPAVLYAYPTNHNITGKKPGLVLFFWGCWVEDVEPNIHINHACYHWISFKLPDLESNTLYRIPEMIINVNQYGEKDSGRSRYEIKAQCRMETYDGITGDLTGVQKMEAKAYEGDFEIQ